MTRKHHNVRCVLGGRVTPVRHVTTDKTAARWAALERRYERPGRAVRRRQHHQASRHWAMAVADWLWVCAMVAVGIMAALALLEVATGHALLYPVPGEVTK